MSNSADDLVVREIGPLIDQSARHVQSAKDIIEVGLADQYEAIGRMSQERTKAHRAPTSDPHQRYV